MTKQGLVIALAALLLAGCTREVLSPTARRLGEVTVESEAGQMPVLVTAEGVWRAASLADWIAVDEGWHRDRYTVVLHYGSNQSVEGLHRPARSGAVLIETADGAQKDTIVVHQKGWQL